MMFVICYAECISTPGELEKLPDHGGKTCPATYSNRNDRVAQLAEHWASIPKVVVHALYGSAYMCN
jgi:hypothetical protein